jgi:hypothetical protein
MRRGYNHDIRAEAITKRFQGKQWKDIQREIREKYSLNPSVRQMQKWVEDYQGTAEDPSGIKYIAKVIENAADEAKPLAQARMMTEVFPLWSRLQDSPYRLSAFEAGLVSMWSLFEAQVGRENMDKAYAMYRKLRDELPAPAATVPPGFTYEAMKGRKEPGR